MNTEPQPLKLSGDITGLYERLAPVMTRLFLGGRVPTIEADGTLTYDSPTG